MEEYIKETIEIDIYVLKALKKYCKKEDISINGFIRANLEALGII